MAHQSQLESKKYRNWVKAGLGLKYTKEGLEPFCDHLVKQQHADILNKVQQKHNLSTVSCGFCDIRTLQPDHVQTKGRQCPLGQVRCNCQHPSGKVACPNNVCGAIYDEVIKLHASTPPAPYWKNTEVKYWCTEPWAIGKCFINVPGYDTQSRASEFDCPALLHVLLNNMDFQNHLQCTGTDSFSKVLKYRNTIFHSPDMELDDNDVTVYIDDMIAVLEDGKELFSKEESKSAVRKLQELKSEDFVITTIDESEVRNAAKKALNEKEKELEEAISKAKRDIGEETSKSKHELKKAKKEAKDDILQAGMKSKTQSKNELDKYVKDAMRTLKDEEIRGKKELELKRKEEEKKFEEKIRKFDDRSQESEPASEPVRPIQNPDEYIKLKAGFQKKPIDGYKKYAMKASALPLQQEKYQRDIWDVFVPAWMTDGIKSTEDTQKTIQKSWRNYWDKFFSFWRTNNKINNTEDTQKTKRKSISMDELFIHYDENPAGNIYVLVEAGSGNSSFC